jgi:APA family basic amino acid/polyamine antiporter
VSPATISAIAIVATLNTILAEMTMAARVIYGMARQGDLPRVMGDVHAKTATPLRATAIIVVMVLALGMAVPFVRLAESTSIATLVVFALVNVALLRLRWKGVPAHGKVFRVPLWVPIAGLVTCIIMIGSATLG